MSCSQLESAAMEAENPKDSDPLLDGIHLSPITPPSPVSFDSEIKNDDIEAGYIPCCIICLQSDGDDDELISPCMCKGTQQFVHRCCLDHWRSIKEGFAFSHCSTCKAQFHVRVADVEFKSWRKMKFKLFVARDIFLVFLAVQAVIATIGGLAYAMDKDGTFRNAFNDSWDRILSKHPVPFYYSVGVLSFIVVVGVIGLVLHCASLASTDQRVAGCQNCCYGCSMLDCFPASMEACFGLVIACIVLFTILGIAYGFFAFSMMFQRIWQRHYHIMAKKDLTKEFVVVDLKGNYTPPTMDPEVERHLRALNLI